MANNKEEKKIFHAFRISVAVALGVEKACILFTISHWIQSNIEQKSKIHFFNGSCWTWLSRGTIHKNMPYLKKSSVGRWLIELEDDGWVESILNEDKNPSEKGTKAYTLTTKYYDLIASENDAQNEQTPAQNEQTPAQNEQTPAQNEQLQILSINTFSNTNNKESKSEIKNFDTPALSEKPFELKEEEKGKEKSCAKKESDPDEVQDGGSHVEDSPRTEVQAKAVKEILEFFRSSKYTNSDELFEQMKQELENDETTMNGVKRTFDSFKIQIGNLDRYLNFYSNYLFTQNENPQMTVKIVLSKFKVALSWIPQKFVESDKQIQKVNISDRGRYSNASDF